MKVTISLVKNEEEADDLINMAERDLKYSKHTLESFTMKVADSAEQAIRRQQELTMAEADLAAIDIHINTLPEGLRKEEEITRRLGIELKIRKLSYIGSTSDSVTLLRKEYNAALLEARIAQIEKYVAAIKERKAELEVH